MDQLFCHCSRFLADKFVKGVGECHGLGQVDRQAGSLLEASVLRTLVYLSTHHYQAAENLLHSPLAMRKMHRLTDKQLTWVVLRAGERVEAWGDCEKLVVEKEGRMGGKKVIGSAALGRWSVFWPRLGLLGRHCLSS